MNIERLIGVEVESLGGTTIGEIVGIEIFGAKMHVVIASNYDFEGGGPEGDGVPVETDQESQFDLFDGKQSKSGENVLNFCKMG